MLPSGRKQSKVGLLPERKRIAPQELPLPGCQSFAQLAVAMKKILFRGLIVVVLLLVIAVIAVALTLNTAVHKGVETLGSQIAKVDVQLDDVDLSLFSGSGKVEGLVVGNPEGYKTSNAMSMAVASLAISPSSLLSDKVVVKSIRLEAPKITFELGPGGSNLQRIQANIESTTGGGEPKPEEPKPASDKPGKKLQVDEVVVTGGTVTLGIAMLGGKVIEAPLPEIRLNNLGQGPEGITGGELAKVILWEVNKQAIQTYSEKLAQAGAEALQNLGAQATNVVNKVTTDAINRATKGLDGLLNKKAEEPQK